MMALLGISLSCLFLLAAVRLSDCQRALINSLDDTYKNQRCEPLDITHVTICRYVGYNVTLLPNELGHTTQKDAGLVANQYYPLIEVKCYNLLRFFVCAVYLPMCLPTFPTYVPPCRYICHEAKSRCEGLMRSFGFDWPDDLRCDKFPESGRGQLCAGNESAGTGPDIPLPTEAPSITAQPVIHPSTPNPFEGGLPYWHTNKTIRIPCDGEHFFTTKDRTTTKVWVGVWSTLCLVASLLVVLTYSIDRTRFNYPERPVIYLAGCYAVLSLAYLISLMADDKVACKDGHLVSGEISSAGCTIIAVMLYYSWMAAALWWVVLAFTWFLAASLKWAPEGIARHSFKYHLLAWGVALVQTIALIISKKADADELTGACLVGNHDPVALAGFVIAPLCIYLVVGSLLFIYGFTSLVTIRSVIRQSHGHSKTDKLEKLMVRVAVFSILYAVPTAIVIGCLFYENQNQNSWKFPNDGSCLKVSHLALNGHRCRGSEAKPSLFMVKLFMILIVGLTSGIWIWSSKTVDTWKRRLGHRVPQAGGYKATRIRSDSSGAQRPPSTHQPSTVNNSNAPSVHTGQTSLPTIHQQPGMRPMYPQYMSHYA